MKPGETKICLSSKELDQKIEMRKKSSILEEEIMNLVLQDENNAQRIFGIETQKWNSFCASPSFVCSNVSELNEADCTNRSMAKMEHGSMKEIKALAKLRRIVLHHIEKASLSGKTLFLPVEIGGNIRPEFVGLF